MARGKRAEKTEPKQNGEKPGPGHNQLTDDQRAALTFDHRRKYEAALAAKRKADSDLKQICKVAKADLGEEAVANIKTMIELATAEGEAKLKVEIERRMRVARWMGLPVGEEPDMFATDRTPAVDRAAMEGKRDGLAGDPCKPSYDPSTPQYKSYMDAFHEGQRVLAGGIKPLTQIEAAAKSEAIDSLTH